MRKIMIAVCDTDQAYAERLGEWISWKVKRNSMEYPIPPWNVIRKGLTARTQTLYCWGNVFLNILKYRRNCLKETKRRGRNGTWPSVDVSLRRGTGSPVRPRASGSGKIPACIPDSAEDILSLSKLGEKREQEPVAEREIIGIYSPGHSIWQTPFALTFAQALGQKEKVLYVNLKECAGFSGWFQEEYEKDLLDVMYLCLTNEVNVSECVNSALYTMEGIHYIPPAEDGGCLGEISSQDYLNFVRLLAGKSGYDVILLDFGMMIPGFYRILEECSRIYITTEPGEQQEAPLLQFQQMTARQENMKLEKKLVYLSLPAMHQEVCTGTARLQQWIWGVMGDFSRRLAGV